MTAADGMSRRFVQTITAFLLVILGGWLISEPAGAVQVSGTSAKSHERAVEHKTKFDPEMVPGLSGRQAVFPLSNSRQLVRMASGYWLLAFDVPREGLFISYAAPGSLRGSQFSPPVLLVGRDDSQAVYKSAEPAGISLAVSDQALYLAWSDERGVRLADVLLPDFSSSASFEQSFRRKPAAELIAPKGTLGDLTTDARGRLILAYALQGVFVATRSGETWKHEKVADAGSEPTLELDKEGDLHLAYCLQTEVPFFGPGRTAKNSRVVYATRKAEGWQAPQLVAQGLSFFPAITVAGNQPVIAYQSEGLKRVEPQGGKYPEQREGGVPVSDLLPSLMSIGKPASCRKPSRSWCAINPPLMHFREEFIPWWKKSRGPKSRSTSTAFPGSSGLIRPVVTPILPVGWALVSLTSTRSVVGLCPFGTHYG